MRWLALYESTRIDSTELLAVSSDPEVVGFVSDFLAEINPPKKSRPDLRIVADNTTKRARSRNDAA